MTAYDIGSIVGRLLASVVIVYFFVLIFNRFKFKFALSKLARPLSIISILLIFVLGIAVNAKAAADSERALRPFAVTKIPEAGLVMYIPTNPPWNMQLQQRNGAAAVILSTPPLYYPPTSMEIVLNNGLKVHPKEFGNIAITALNTVRNKAGIQSEISLGQLSTERYGDIETYVDVFDMRMDGESYSAKSLIGLMPSGKPVMFFLVTQKGEIEHISHMAKKIWSNLKELNISKRNNLK